MYLACEQAYPSDNVKRERCYDGCNKMMAVQSTAPYVTGWHVYMGAAERNLVFLRTDVDVPSQENWIALDALINGDVYENDIICDENEVHQVQLHTGHQHRFMIKYCVPTWMWTVPLLLLIGFIWMQYSNYIYGAFLREGLEQELIKNHDKRIFEQNYVMGTDLYLYPTPSMAPPPKYNEAVAIDVSEPSEIANGTDIEKKG